MLFAIILFAVQFMFSADGITPGSALRDLPSQGVSLKTHQVVVGLHALSDVERADCGWYRYTPVRRPDTNNYWRVTNYIFRASGTVENVWSRFAPKPLRKKYCKTDIISGLSKIGEGAENKWIILRSAIEAAGMMDLWNAAVYIPADDQRFVAVKPRVCEVLGWTEKQLDDFLENCIY